MKKLVFYSEIYDAEYGMSKSGGDEDNSKNKRPNILVRWKKYSRKFYLLGFGFCILCLLYFAIVRISGNIQETLAHSGTVVPLPRMLKLMIVADLDQNSRVQDEKKGVWRSILKKAELRITEGGVVSIHWLEDQDLFSMISEAGRGMELSALVNYNNHLYAFDDRTGIAYELVKGNRAIPRFIMMEGDGNTDKGQKTEWATVKDDKMYVGSFGKEYTNKDGTIKNTNNMWITIIDKNGLMTHVDWTKNYNKLRDALRISYPGYMIHEAINWSAIRKQWVILPRRVSAEPYDEVEDERRGSNIVILASEDFGKIEVKQITQLTPTRGFSEFKFLPGSKDSIIVALKSEENEAQQIQNSYITVFSLDGNVLLEETIIPGNHKFEGLEFHYF